MDTHDVTDEYFQMLQNQKKLLQKAKKRQGQHPRDWKPKEQLYFEFMITVMGQEQMGKEHLVHSSFIPPAYLPCTTPLSDLKRVTIRQLQLETHHRGTYILLRAITPPNRMTAIMALVEDECADVVLIQLYQQEEEDIRKAVDVVDVGTILLVKEPFLKVMASGDYGLRVDHLSDVIRLDEYDPRRPKSWQPRILELNQSVESFRLSGNSAVGEGDYWKAIREYSKALSRKAKKDEVEIIKRNRSLAYLKTKQFDAALNDTGFPKFGPKSTEKALFRAAEALYFLERFTECCQVVEQLNKNYPDNKQALSVLDRARSRCVEEKTGEYRFKLLQNEAKKLKPPQLDHATYIGPVEIRSAGSKGRGLFVTQAVKAGELLLCEKAFTHAWVAKDEDEGTHSKMTLLMNPETGQGFMGGQADLIKITAQKLYRNPSLARRFTSLHCGTYDAASTSSVDGTPIVDTFLVERIMCLNVFGCPNSSLATYTSIINDDSKEPHAHHSCGIWTQASHINHSCTSTARRSFIGDMMIVRANQDLEPGTEVTFWYHVPDGVSSQKFQKKLKPWGFDCDCAICCDAKETKTTVSAERKRLLEKMKQLCEKPTIHDVSTDKIERLLKTLNQTYTKPAAEVPRLLLWDPQLFLARIYLSRNNVKKVLESAVKVLTALGFVIVGGDSSSRSFEVVKWGMVVDHLVEAFLHARDAFKTMGAWDDFKRAEGYARVAYSILVGETSSFESTYAKRGYTWT